MLYITRKEHFNAAHRLYRDDWSEEKNYKVFGKCANKNWHGHNFEIYVTVKGKPNPETGFIIDLKDLGKIINEFIIEKLDHKNLNLDVDFMKGKMPSIENLAVSVWKELLPHITEQNCLLHCIKIIETENNYVEYFGEEIDN